MLGRRSDPICSGIKTPRLMPLTEQQREALLVLDWLFDESDETRASGRSLILAIAYIRQAAKSPGRMITVQDHCPIKHAATFVLHRVVGLIEDSPQLRLYQRIWRPQNRFQLNLPHPIFNWYPNLHGVPRQGHPIPQLPNFWEHLEELDEQLESQHS